MTICEQRYFENMAFAAAELAKALPRIAESLSSISKDIAEIKTMLKGAGIVKQQKQGEEGNGN